MKTHKTVALLAVSLAVAIPCLSPSPARGADDAISVSLAEAMKLLEGVPNLEGKSEEEVKRIVDSNPDIRSRVERAERKVRSAIDEAGLGPDNASLAAAMKELESISELQGKSEEEIAQIMASDPDVRGRVSSAGRSLAAAVGGTAAAGEASDKEADGGSNPAGEGAEKPLVPDAVEIDLPAPDAEPTVLDDVFFGELHWDFGGFKGEKAEKGDVQIAGLKMKKDGLSFKYVEDLSHWGMSHTDYSGALACLFVCDRDGRWVGGKFDWISSSRKTRSFKNVYGGYNGWSLSNVPNPCPVAFVIVSKDGKKRSNVIAGIWKR